MTFAKLPAWQELLKRIEPHIILLQETRLMDGTLIDGQASKNYRNKWRNKDSSELLTRSFFPPTNWCVYRQDNARLRQKLNPPGKLQYNFKTGGLIIAVQPHIQHAFHNFAHLHQL